MTKTCPRKRGHGTRHSNVKYEGMDSRWRGDDRGSWKLGVGSWELEEGSWKKETGDGRGKSRILV